MNTANEEYLWERIPEAGKPGITPRATIADMIGRGLIDSEKQAWRTLEKWAKKGKYEYGVCIDMGWKTT
jgi:hypothetical protein